MSSHYTNSLNSLVREIRECRVCDMQIPLGSRPIIHVSEKASLLIIGQAPGTKAHSRNKSFDDASGIRLRSWLNLSEEIFYNTQKIAILPMGLCYPGKMQRGGDCPPRPECALLWHKRVLSLLPNIQLTLLIGSYSQNYYLDKNTVTNRVKNFQHYLSKGFFPLPHPSWRTTAWERKNTWFQNETIPNLRKKIHEVLR